MPKPSPLQSTWDSIDRPIAIQAIIDRLPKLAVKDIQKLASLAAHLSGVPLEKE